MTDRGALVTIGFVSAVVVGGVAVLLLGLDVRPGAASEVSRLPALNAVLNGVSAGLLSLGYALIRARRRAAHRTAMLSAFGVSSLFLASYVVYHASAGSRPFTGTGWLRPVYFALLVSHMLLAAVIVPLALMTIWRALRGQFDRHRRLARWTLPLWLYVSVTGVVIYWMLYHL